MGDGWKSLRVATRSGPSGRLWVSVKGGLAKRCGLSWQASRATEAGHYIPNTTMALRLDRVLRCTVEEVFRLPEELPCVEAEWLGEPDIARRAAGILPSQVRGYARQVPTHFAVGEAVDSGTADVGPGILAVARMLALDFVPLQRERYDLVIPLEFLNTPAVQALLDVAVSAPFRGELEALGGYDTSRTGTVVAELVS